jgi:hypothetical protein
MNSRTSTFDTYSVHLTCFGFPNYAHSGYPIDVRCRVETGRDIKTDILRTMDDQNVYPIVEHG